MLHSMPVRNGDFILVPISSRFVVGAVLSSSTSYTPTITSFSAVAGAKIVQLYEYSPDTQSSVQLAITSLSYNRTAIILQEDLLRSLINEKYGPITPRVVEWFLRIQQMITNFYSGNDPEKTLKKLIKEIYALRPQMYPARYRQRE